MINAAPKKKIDAKAVSPKFVIPQTVAVETTESGSDDLEGRFYKLYHLEGDEYTTSKAKYLEHNAKKALKKQKD